MNSELNKSVERIQKDAAVALNQPGKIGRPFPEILADIATSLAILSSEVPSPEEKRRACRHLGEHQVQVLWNRNIRVGDYHEIDQRTD